MGRWCVKRASRSVADSSRPATERRSLSDRRHRGGDGALDQLHGLRPVARSEGLQGLIDLGDRRILVGAVDLPNRHRAIEQPGFGHLKRLLRLTGTAGLERLRRRAGVVRRVAFGPTGAVHRCAQSSMTSW